MTCCCRMLPFFFLSFLGSLRNSEFAGSGWLIPLCCNCPGFSVLPSSTKFRRSAWSSWSAAPIPATYSLVGGIHSFLLSLIFLIFFSILWYLKAFHRHFSRVGPTFSSWKSIIFYILSTGLDLPLKSALNYINSTRILKFYFQIGFKRIAIELLLYPTK